MASGTPVSATVDDLVRDAHALVVELDLYKRPLGLVGVGLGAVIALLFAARHPDIVAALWTSGLPQLRLGPSAAANPIAYNLSFLPDAKHARLVPGPAAIEETVSAIAAANSFAAEPPPGPEGRARHAAAVLQEDEVASARLHVPRGQYRTTLDRSFVCPGPTQEQVLSALSQVEVPATVVFPDTPCARESREELTAEVLGRRVAGAGSPPLRLATLLGVQRISPTDDPDDVAEDVAAWLDAHRERFDDPRGPAGRTPEHLGLLPLPTFRCPEEARRYLGPRRVPDAAAIEAALRQLRADDEAPSTPSSEASGDGARTALCADPPTYYGRVG
ncbi:unnamed protein product [Pedinophyceae sp. YPF-701]|nr:unnamed protein product [Pedinophyceae sp. YPF-701]